MADKLTMFQSSTAGDRQPISSGDRKTPNAWSRMHVALKTTCQRECIRTICYSPHSKSCTDLSGVMAQLREYFFGMKEAVIKLICSRYVGARAWSI